MTPEKQVQVDAHVRAIAQLLYANAKAEGMPTATLGEIERTVRQQMRTYVSPGDGNFLSKQIAQKNANHPEG